MNSDFFANLGLYLVLFYMTISTNFIGELFNKNIRNVLSDNYYVKHILGYFTLLIFIVFSSGKKDNLVNDFKLSIIAYILFVMSTKLNPNYFVISSLLLFSSYIIYKINELYTKDINNKKIIN